MAFLTSSTSLVILLVILIVVFLSYTSFLSINLQKELYSKDLLIRNITSQRQGGKQPNLTVSETKPSLRVNADSDHAINMNPRRPINNENYYNSTLLNFFDSPDFQDIQYPMSHHSIGQEDYFLERLYQGKLGKMKLNGFFIEMGAIDGTKFSNTRLLEKSYGWRGMLFEPNPQFCGQLITSDRYRSLKLCIAICTGTYIDFSVYSHGNDGSHGKAQLLDLMHPDYVSTKKTFPVVCNKLYDILSIFNVQKIDVFVLDVELAESDVLETFDWNIPVNYWIIEAWASLDAEKENKRKVIEILTKHGYIECNPTPTYPNICYELPGYK